MAGMRDNKEFIKHSNVTNCLMSKINISDKVNRLIT